MKNISHVDKKNIIDTQKIFQNDLNVTHNDENDKDKEQMGSRSSCRQKLKVEIDIMEIIMK